MNATNWKNVFLWGKIDVSHSQIELKYDLKIFKKKNIFTYLLIDTYDLSINMWKWFGWFLCYLSVHVFLGSIRSEVLLFPKHLEGDAPVFQVVQFAGSETVEGDHALVFEFGGERSYKTRQHIFIARTSKNHARTCPKITHLFTLFSIEIHAKVTDNPGRPSMDILVRSWQYLAKILPRTARCHGKILSREPCSQEKFYCIILFDQKKIWKEVHKNQHLCRYTLLDMIFCK